MVASASLVGGIQDLMLAKIVSVVPNCQNL